MIDALTGALRLTAIVLAAASVAALVARTVSPTDADTDDEQ